MDYQHIVYPNEILSMGRPIGRVDENKLIAYITEAEQMYVKPVLGNELFIELISYKNNPKFKILFEGGIYESSCGGKRCFAGLKLAVAYFVFANIIMSGDFQSTRFGIMYKSDDYSSHISSKERSDYYNNTIEVANQYLKECAEYCKSVSFIKKSGNSFSSGSIRIKKIG